MSSIRNRLIVIAILTLASVVALLPRRVRERSHDPVTGVMRDTLVRRVPINLGLDLRGGMHLALEIDESKGKVADCADAIRRAERVVRARVNEFGTTEPVVQVLGDCRLIVELAGVHDAARARAIVQRTAFLEFRLTDSRNAFAGALPAIDAALRQAGIAPASATGGATVERLLGAGSTRADANVLSSYLAPGSMPGEMLVRERDVATVDALLARPEIERVMPRGLELRWSAQPLQADGEDWRALYALEQRAIVTGEELTRAVVARDPITGAPAVQFDLTRVGGTRFADATSRHVGDHLAIVLDGRVQGPPPVITTRIGSSGLIQLNGRSLEEAADLALTLRAGALPAPLQVVNERTIGPALGLDSIRDGVRASMLAVGFVLVVMAVYYGTAGLLAIAALGFYVLYTLGGLAAFGFSLTLPGLAGFALSIGMAVDANVLIFERMREGLAAGRSVRAAVDGGFHDAMSAIVDSNVTTALTAMILYAVGTDSVRGFALTLLVGLAASMLSAVFVTRTLFLLWLRRKPALGALRRRTIELLADSAHDFMGLRRRALTLAAAVILPGLVLLGARGLTYSIEFTGGAMLQIETRAGVGTEALRAALAGGGLPGAEIQTFGSDREFVIRARIGSAADAAGASIEEISAAARAALDAGIGSDAYEVRSVESVKPKVGAELQQKALIAILLSFVSTLIYLAFRFEWRFGLAAVLATAHDILATLAFIRYLDLEVSLVVVAAVLTVLGYSLNDTIVIFDRVRENLRGARRSDFVATLNRSIIETLPRTLLTGGTTMATALVLGFLAGEVIRPFGLIMAFGIVTGTLSSIFIAAPMLLWIERRWSSPDVVATAVAERAPATAGGGA